MGYGSYSRRPKDNWVAPEHARFARSMERDWVRDDLGRPVNPRKRELVINKKPLVMREREIVEKST